MKVTESVAVARVNQKRELWVISLVVPLSLFWVILAFTIPDSFSGYFFAYSLSLFLLVWLLYYISFKLLGNYGVVAGFGLTMILFALTLSYRWTSGYSDNFVIGGLLPYKDAKNYYLGAKLLLNGFPLNRAGQSTERPLFPGFLSTLLLITQQNLKIALAILVQFAGIGSYLAARKIFKVFGALSASIFAVFLYFYIQPLIGLTMSELIGFAAGCFAFVLLSQSAETLNGFDLALGILTLLIAVSARAGAFLIFPLLLLWIGWIYRGSGRFSIKIAIYVAIGLAVGYFLVNSVYGQLLGIPSGSSFSNFSYALYGQVRGGTGWHSAIEELGTREPSDVYRAAFRFFLAHPFSLVIGIMKSYWDFFLPGFSGIFAFGINGQDDWLTYVMWGLGMIFLAGGLLWLIRHARSRLVSLFLVGFAGMLLSIPFLPPIDGGSRFYASTMPFFFVVPSLALNWWMEKDKVGKSSTWYAPGNLTVLRLGSILLLTSILIIPVLIFHGKSPLSFNTPICASGQQAFVIRADPASYIDLISGGTKTCGMVPDVCLADFAKNGTQGPVDDFYRDLLSLARTSKAGLRIMPAINLLDGQFHYFVADDPSILNSISSGQVISGCAIETCSKNQSIFQIIH